ncbi:hypothetical protein HOB94_01795 [bacterium]|nr:hypothetical protein [bacterium]
MIGIIIYLFIIVGGIYLATQKNKTRDIKNTDNSAKTIASFLNKDFPGSSSTSKELKKQVENYDTLNKTSSSRGIASIILALFLVRIFSEVLQGNTELLTLIIYLIIYIPLIILIYKGKMISMLLVIIIWTIDNFYTFSQTNDWFSLILWFIIFMILAQALQVESIRRKQLKNNILT